jgi:hypothetical protein
LHPSTFQSSRRVVVRLVATFLAGMMGVLPAASVSAQPTALPAVPGDPAAVRQKVLVLRAESAAMADSARSGLTKEIHSQTLRYKRFDAQISGADLVEQMFEFECTEAGTDCLTRIGRKEGAQLVLYSEVVKTPAGTLALGLRLIDVATSKVVQTTQQPLENPDKPGAAVTKALTAVLGASEPAVETTSEQPGTLHVLLFGGGVALVYVDEKLAGRTSVSGLKVSVTAGPHTVRVVRSGYREWSGRVVARAGETVMQSVMLEQLAEATQAPKPMAPLAPQPAEADDEGGDSITRQWWFWTALGVVVVGAAVGVGLATSQTDSAPTGTAAFSMDQNDAHKDPVFGGASGN